MTPLATSSDCDRTDWLCREVYRATHLNWLASTADWLIAKPIAILSIIVLGLVLRWLASKLITRLIERAASGRVLPAAVLRGRSDVSDPERDRLLALAAERRMQRAETMASVLRSCASFVILTIVAIMVIAELGYNIGPLVASAGLIGAALGFGAQSLVKDFLSGIFMFFEDQFGVGDKVVIGETEGVVEALALRITRLRSEDGTTWYIRNGEILRVGNVSQRADPEVPQP
jgi:small-conductance mechanosensitive channel